MEFKKIVKLQVEHRYDPLTGQETRINPARANRPKQGEGDNPFDEVIKKSQERCPFCPDKILEKVPKFPEHIAKDGRVRKNQTIIFPNLNPFGSNHAVGVISDAHYLPMDKYEPNLLHDALVAAQAYVKTIHHHEKSSKYPTLVWNFLPPSAGSIIHPHIQMLVEDEPVPALKDRIKKLEAYFQAHKRNYFADLIEHEKKKGERYLGGNESVEVITTFAPRGYNEIEFIVPRVSSLGDMNEKQLQDLAVVLYQALLGYKSYGVGSFNLASYSGAFGEEREDFWLHFKLFSRPFPNGVYTNDTGPMERMYDSWVIDSIPEKLNEAVKPFFSK